MVTAPVCRLTREPRLLGQVCGNAALSNAEHTGHVLRATGEQEHTLGATMQVIMPIRLSSLL